MLKISRLAAIAIMLLGARLTAQSTPVTELPSALNPGDQVRIAVWRNVEFSGDFTVAANGTINHPLYREIQVTGIPLSQVEDRVRTFLTRYIANPQFAIQPLVRIIVGGEVRTPNIYAVPPETTLAQALALAGGPTERGDLKKVRVVRDGQTIPIDLLRADSEVARLQIRSGDQILIPRRGTPAREYLAPTFSMIAAAASIVNIFWR
jgi:polysaccharide export outer membrane protein